VQRRYEGWEARSTLQGRRQTLQDGRRANRTSQPDARHFGGGPQRRGGSRRHLLPGSGEKPANVYAHGIGNQGRDIAIDVAIVDSQTGGTDAELQRRPLATLTN
jgi:hypothetical protein